MGEVLGDGVPPQAANSRPASIRQRARQVVVCDVFVWPKMRFLVCRVCGRTEILSARAAEILNASTAAGSCSFQDPRPSVFALPLDGAHKGRFFPNSRCNSP